MAKVIGPRFAAELEGAGLAGLPFAWGADGTFTFDPSMLDAQQDAVLAVYAAHDPAATATKSTRETDQEACRAVLDAAAQGGSVTLRDLAAALRKVL